MGITRTLLCGHPLLGSITDAPNLLARTSPEIPTGIEFGVFFFNIRDNIDGRRRVTHSVLIGIKIVGCFVFDFVFDSIRHETDHAGVV